MSQAIHWCYTLNNPTAPLELPDTIYHIYGEEVGESGTPHYQGYVVFEKRKRLTQLKKLSPTAHWEVAKGTPLQASDYCKKDGKFHETGELPEHQGAKGGAANKRKYDDAFAKAKEGNLLEIESNLLIRHYSTWKKIRHDFHPKPVPRPTLDNEWISGETGVGKTSGALKRYPDAYMKPCNKWWDGYNYEEVVIIDDMDLQCNSSDGISHRNIKIWTDHNPFIAEFKGGSMLIRPAKLIFTSQYTLDRLYSDPETLSALQRRFTEINL